MPLIPTLRRQRQEDHKFEANLSVLKRKGDCKDGSSVKSTDCSCLKAINVDLQSDAALQVDISDALSERDKVKFTVHTKSSLPNFKQDEFSVVRQHEEFIWLHDSFVENEDYAGYIVSIRFPFLVKIFFLFLMCMHLDVSVVAHTGQKRCCGVGLTGRL
uniref:Sorting nexin-6 n=1 Tax=Peromyscus maniculatus bairdii TaxID=230844 RepID=A0A8C8W4D6_PERMB